MECQLSGKSTCNNPGRMTKKMSLLNIYVVEAASIGYGKTRAEVKSIPERQTVGSKDLKRDG